MLSTASVIQELSGDGHTETEALKIAADVHSLNSILERLEKSLGVARVDDLVEIARQSNEQQMALSNILNRLSEREKTCFLLHHVEQKSFQGIADELNISKGAVQTYITRAREKISKVN